MATGGTVASMETSDGLQFPIAAPPYWFYEAKEKDGLKIYQFDQNRRANKNFETACWILHLKCHLVTSDGGDDKPLLIEIDTWARVAKFTGKGLRLQVPASRLRYAAILPEDICRRFFGCLIQNVVLVSYRTSLVRLSDPYAETGSPQIGFVLLTCTNEECLLKLMDQFWRLMYCHMSAEGVEDSMVQTLLRKFQPLCVGHRQIVVENKDGKQADQSGASLTGEGQKSDNAQEVFFIIDSECCHILQSLMDEYPIHSALYYTEKGSDVVEQVIYNKMSFDLTIIVTEKKIIFPYCSVPVESDDLIETVKKLVPVDPSTYSDPRKLAHHFSMSTVRGPEDYEKIKLSREFPTLGFQPGVGFQPEEHSNFAQSARMKEELDNVLAANADQEWIEFQWITVEADLKDILDSGTVVRKDFRSAAFDPDSEQHLKKCFTEIKEALLAEKYGLALGLIQGTRVVFSETNTNNIKCIFEDTDTTLLQKLYYQAMAGNI